MSEADERPDPTRCKVGRLIAEHDLTGLGAELERRWTAPADERDSLRELADLVNRRLLEAVLREAGDAPTSVGIEGRYEALTGDVDAATRTRTRRELERAGVDVDGLQDAFVTHQAVHTYLTEYRGASYESEPRTVADEQATLARLRNRTSAVTASALDRLADAGLVAERDYEPIVTVQVLCADCGRSHDVDDLLDAGGCDCGAGEPAATDDGTDADGGAGDPGATDDGTRPDGAERDRDDARADHDGAAGGRPDVTARDDSSSGAR